MPRLRLTLRTIPLSSGSSVRSASTSACVLPPRPRAVTTQTTAVGCVVPNAQPGGTRSVASVTKERLSGLSDELRSETFEYRNGALALHTHSSFDPTNSILTEVSESATSGTTTTKSKYGVVIETTTSAGTTTNFFDPYGRVFYTEKDGRSVDWIGRNDYGDVEEYDTFHSEGNAYYAEFYGYDSLGNRIVATNAVGAATSSAYDAENRLAESSGDDCNKEYGQGAAGTAENVGSETDRSQGEHIVDHGEQHLLNGEQVLVDLHLLQER